MAQKIREVMTEKPATMAASATVAEAARTMRDRDIGDVIVLQDDRVCGIVTDRDIVVRGVAQGRDPGQTKLADICSRDLTTVTPNDEVADAVRLMKEKAVRRLPVVESGQPVGIVSIGDLATEQDRRSALGEISAAPPNR
jgi:CBS domain-containing protein